MRWLKRSTSTDGLSWISCLNPQSPFEVIETYTKHQTTDWIIAFKSTITLWGDWNRPHSDQSFPDAIRFKSTITLWGDWNLSRRRRTVLRSKRLNPQSPFEVIETWFWCFPLSHDWGFKSTITLWGDWNRPTLKPLLYLIFKVLFHQPLNSTTNTRKNQ